VQFNLENNLKFGVRAIAALNQVKR